jgi:DNA polymerase III gamma/tau subunit
MKFRFKPISKQCIIDKLKFIAKNENMDIDDTCINTLVEISEGDARMAIMSLQNLKYITNYKKNVTSEDIIKITGGIDKIEFKNFWKTCKKSIYDVRKLAITINKNGYPIKAILAYLNECNINSDLSDIKKSKISIEICNTDRRLLGNADQYIQILNILIYINKIIKNQEQ